MQSLAFYNTLRYNTRRTMQEISLLAYALLGLLRQQPRSGYDLRKIFANTPMGTFSDSPGAIYPALQRLEKHGLVSSRVHASSAQKCCSVGPKPSSEFTGEEKKEDHENETSRCTLLFARRLADQHRRSWRRPFRLVVALRDPDCGITRSRGPFRPAQGARPIWSDTPRSSDRHRALHLVRGPDPSARLQPARTRRPARLRRNVSDPRAPPSRARPSFEIIPFRRDSRSASLPCRCRNHGSCLRPRLRALLLDLRRHYLSILHQGLLSRSNASCRASRSVVLGHPARSRCVDDSGRRSCRPHFANEALARRRGRRP